MEESRAIARLQADDPNRTRIVIDLVWETSDALLTQALERNTFITDISVDFRGVQDRTGWPLLRGHISRRARLTKLWYTNDAQFGEPAPASLIVEFLQAAQANVVSLEQLTLSCFKFDLHSADFTFLCNTFVPAPIVCLQFFNCDMANPAQREEGTRALSSINIKRLGLCGVHGSSVFGFASVLLRKLAQNTSLTHFSLNCYSCFTGANPLSSAVGQLLEETTALQRFELSCGTVVSQQFGPIANGLINSTVCEFSILSAVFSPGAENHFRRILRDKKNLSSLSIHGDVRFAPPLESRKELVQSLTAALLRPESALRHLEYHHNSNQLTTTTTTNNNNFSALMKAMEKSKLEGAKIGGIVSRQEVEALKHSIPLLRIRELDVEVKHPLVAETVKEILLDAVKCNFSLRSVKGSFKGSDTQNASPLFNRVEDQRRLAFYANRNEHVDRWSENPETIERYVWPYAVHRAQQAGRDTLYTSLQSVLGGDYVNLRASRKRKRSAT